MRKQKPYADNYASLDDVFKKGIYRGKTLREILEIKPKYLYDSYHHGYINLTPELLITAKKIGYQYVKSKSIAIQNSAAAKRESYIQMTKKQLDEAIKGGLCLHEACYCAHHGCSHFGKTKCDENDVHEEGAIAAQFSDINNWATTIWK